MLYASGSGWICGRFVLNEASTLDEIIMIMKFERELMNGMAKLKIHFWINIRKLDFPLLSQHNCYNISDS